MRNGTRVKIIDENLKSCGFIGTVVGKKADGSTKIYLDKTVGKGVYLICIKDKGSFIPIKEETTSFADYIKDRLVEIKNELQRLEEMVKGN